MSEPVGALGDEAARLLAAAEQWWRDARHDADPAEPATPPQAHLGPECSVCPVCQLLASLRTARPELFEHLSSAAVSLMHAVRSTFEASGGSWQPPQDGPAVERIDIR